MSGGMGGKGNGSRKSVCVVHTGAEEVFTVRRFREYGSQPGLGFDFHEIVDELAPLSEEAVARLRPLSIERMSHCDYLMVLAGDRTSQLAGSGLQAVLSALYMRRPVIVVNLDGERHCDPTRLPLVLEGKLFLCISSELPILDYALDSWRDEAYRLLTMNQSYAAVYPDELYSTVLGEQDLTDAPIPSQRFGN